MSIRHVVRRREHRSDEFEYEPIAEYIQSTNDAEFMQAAKSAILHRRPRRWHGLPGPGPAGSHNASGV
jgi:hypothetical protein